MRWYKRIPLQKKLLFNYMVLVLLMLTVFFVLAVHKMAKDDTERYAQLLRESGKTAEEELTHIVEDVKKTSAMYFLTPKVIEYIEKDFNIDTEDYVDTLREMKANAASVKANPYISSITYISVSGARYSGAGEDPSYYEYLEGMIRTMGEQGLKNLLSPVYDTVINIKDTRTVTYACSLMNPYTFGTVVGYAFINLDLKKLEERLASITSGNAIGLMTVQDNRAVYREEGLSDVRCRELAVAGWEQREALKEEGARSFELTAGGTPMLCAARYCGALDLVVLGYLPMKAVHEQMYNGIRYYYVEVAVMLAVFAAMSIFSSGRMTRPIRVLREGMRRVEEGNLTVITEQTGRQDDMGELIRGFNSMVTRLDESLIREYELEKLQRKAQIKMLQSQINPHFLYNALNVISSIAELEDVPEISDLAGKLSDMFRYNISSVDVVRLEEELTQTRRYAEVQKMCTSGNVRVEYDVDEETRQYPVLKFLLQPLIENCFKHGFAGGEEGVILVEAHREGKLLLLSVSDTGGGISPERLSELQGMLADSGTLYEEKKKEEDMIGLLNVNFRLKSYYGKECGIDIDSIPGAGTRVTLRIGSEPAGERGGRSGNDVFDRG